MNEEKKYKIVYDRDKCIEFGGCAAASHQFVIANDSKADLINSIKNGEGFYELEINGEELSKNRDAAEICPAKVIKIIDLDTGEQIV